MVKIALLSDTHGYVDGDILEIATTCDEIWHAGDIGRKSVLSHLEETDLPLRAVFGNIDSGWMRHQFPQDLAFEVEGVNVFMTHIGGYPSRYVPRVKEILEKEYFDLYICGHSHILKIMPDKNLNLLHMNPGACGQHGIHAMRTMITFEIEMDKMKNVEVIELGRRGKI